MSRVIREGPARVLHRNGNTFVGYAVYDGNAVTFDGQLADREDRPVIARTWPVADVEVRWLQPAPIDLEEAA